VIVPSGSRNNFQLQGRVCTSKTERVVYACRDDARAQTMNNKLSVDEELVRVLFSCSCDDYGVCTKRAIEDCSKSSKGSNRFLRPFVD